MKFLSSKVSLVFIFVFLMMTGINILHACELEADEQDRIPRVRASTGSHLLVPKPKRQGCFGRKRSKSDSGAGIKRYNRGIITPDSGKSEYQKLSTIEIDGELVEHGERHNIPFLLIAKHEDMERQPLIKTTVIPQVLPLSFLKAILRLRTAEKDIFMASDQFRNPCFLCSLKTDSVVLGHLRKIVGRETSNTRAPSSKVYMLPTWEMYKGGDVCTVRNDKILKEEYQSSYESKYVLVKVSHLQGNPKIEVLKKNISINWVIHKDNEAGVIDLTVVRPPIIKENERAVVNISAEQMANDNNLPLVRREQPVVSKGKRKSWMKKRGKGVSTLRQVFEQQPTDFDY